MLLLFFLVVVLLFSIPKVQTWAAQKATTYVNKKFNTHISIQKLGLNIAGNVNAKEIFIADDKKDTLISAHKLSTSIVSFKNLWQGEAKLKNIVIEDVLIKMETYPNENIDNFRKFISKFTPKQKNKTQKPFELDISEVHINNCRYLYVNTNIIPEPFVDLSKLNLEGRNFKLKGSVIDFYIDKASVVYGNYINVTNLTSQFHFEKGIVSLSDIVLKTQKKSTIKGNFLMTYKEGDMADFSDKVKIKAQVSNSIFATSDLKYFYREFGPNHKVKLTAKLDGVLNNFKLSDINFKGVNNLVLKGNLHLEESMSKNKIEDFKVSGKLHNLKFDKKNLSKLFPNVIGKHLPKELDKLGEISAIGSLEATASSVNYKGVVFSEIGNAKVTVLMDNLRSKSKAHYKGNIDVEDFELNTFFGNSKLGLATFNLDIDGYGFLVNNLNTYLSGQFNRIYYNGYTYKDVGITGILKYPTFDGKVISSDPNFDIRFDGLVNLNETENDYNFKADVNYIDFKKLNILARDSISEFKGQVIANFKGTNVDDTYGEIQFKQTTYKNQNDTYSFKDFQLKSQFLKDGQRLININSPEIIQGEILGRFKLKSLKDLFQNSLASLYKNYEATVATDREFLKFDLKIYNKIVDVFFPDLKVGANTSIKGNVDSDGAKFNLNFVSPNIAYKKNIFEKIDLKIDNSNQNNTLLSIYKVNTEKYGFSNFKLENINKNDTLYSTTTFKGGEQQRDSFNLKLYHTIDTLNHSVVGIEKSFAVLKGNTWYVNQNNDQHHKIEFDNNFKDILIDSIQLNHNNERISLNGVLQDSTYKNVKLKFEEVDLKKIKKSIKNLDYTGVVNGQLNFIQKEGVYLPTSNLSISNFTINNVLIGNFKMDAKGNADLTNYIVNSSVERDDVKSFAINGNISTIGEKPQVNFDVLFNEFELAPFSNLGGIVLSKLRGTINGKAKIEGDYVSPDINGLLTLNKAGLLFQYLNVDLNFEENASITLSKNKFRFNNNNVEDTKFKTKGQLSGIISHQNFKKWNLDLKIESDRLLVLNTNENDNELYYGTAFINGETTIKGPTDQLKIVIDASSAKGTKFKIPISDTETIGDNSFIHFISPAEKASISKGEKVYFEDVKGLELQFELDLNKYAEVEVVIDQESGSTLKGYGAGTLLIEINTNGKFNMWGDFVAYKGFYDFKYGGIVSKRFDVRTGNISWDGSPTEARLDLSAVYSTNANPSIILENAIQNRKIPVEVITSLTGQLLKPELEFNIDFPGASSILKNELEFLLSDRTTRERQALSLISQGQFYSDALIGNNIITENLVEKASDLISNIFADEEDKFNIGFNYNQRDNRDLNNQSSDEFGVSVSTQISKRILINGKVGIPIGGVTQSVVVGDVRIDFLLNEDGTLRATIFNRESDFQFLGEANQYTQGIGLSYSYDFNSFRELIRKILKTEGSKARRRVFPENRK